MASERPIIDVQASSGGWPRPWPAVAEVADVLPTDRWTLVGGLMAQLHTVHRGLGVVRPTNDVDIVLHVETSRGVPAEAAAALVSIGYELRATFDPRENTAHRFVRGADVIDVVTSDAQHDVVDVLVADHAPPSVVEPLLGRDMIRIEGGTQALRRTVEARLEIGSRPVTISVPRPFGALILKAAAYRTDNRDRERHLADAAALLASIDDPFAEREGFAGSDRGRLMALQRALTDDHVVWLALPDRARRDGRAALRVLCQR